MPSPGSTVLPTDHHGSPKGFLFFVFFFMLEQHMSELIHNIVSVSRVQQSDSVTHPEHISIIYLSILVYADVFKHNHCSGERLSLLLINFGCFWFKDARSQPHACFYLFALATFWGNWSAHLKEKDVTNIWDQKTRCCLVSVILASKT